MAVDWEEIRKETINQITLIVIILLIAFIILK